MTPAAFDFRRPPPGELVRQAAAWVAQACRRTAAAWGRLLPYPAELRPGPVDAAGTAAALAGLPEDAVGIPLTTPDPADEVVLLAVRRPLLLALLAGVVGEAASALPEDREPSEVEASLVGYLVRELFLAPLEKAWAVADPPQFAAGPPTPPRAALRGAGDSFLVAAPVVAGPFGEHPVHLLVPRAGRWELLARSEAGAKPPPPAPREQIEALVREMPVDLDVILGTADLTMRDLAGLTAGDVVVLRQKVTQPLDAQVSGARKFLVWPGVIGARAAVVVETRAED